MSKCIYKKFDLNINSSEDSNSRSVEHIIPWSIGGSNGLTTDDASKSANNELGSEVDAPFANTLPIAIMRNRLQIKSQNGNVPPIVWHGTSPDGFKGTMTISPDGSVDVSIDAAVDRPNKGETGPTIISGPREKIEPILTGMLKGIKKRSEVAYSQEGKLLASLNDFWDSSEQKLVDRINFKVKYFDKIAWTRGMLKIALASGHKLLGPEWTFGSDADLLRQTIMNSDENWPTTLRGFIAGELDRNLRLALGKTKDVRDTYQHTVSVLPANRSGNGIIAISLFGGNGVPEALIDIGKLPQSMIDKLNRQDNADTLMGYRVDPKNRSTSNITFGEIDQRIASMGPTNKKSLHIYRERNLK